MAVRTARLAGGTSGPSEALTVIYTCPSGVTAIAKDFRMVKNIVGDVHLGIGVRSGPLTCWIINRLIGAATVTVSEQGFVVLEPGDQLIIYSPTNQGWVYHVSGAELAGVAP